MKKIDIQNLRKKLNLRNLMNNNKVILVLSIFIAIFWWTRVAGGDIENVTSTIKINNVPINIQLSDAIAENNLSAFILGSKNASVEVDGNAMTISRLTSDDIVVTGSKSEDITEQGTYEMFLTAKMKNSDLNVSINQSKVIPNKVKVLIDKYRQEEFTVDGDIKYKTNANYFSNSVSITPSKITVSGPESIVSRIARVSAPYNIVQELTESTKFETQVVFYDNNNNIIPDSDLQKLTISKSSVEGSIELMKKVSSTLEADFDNMPKGFNMNRVSVEPKTIDIACPLISADDINKIKLDKIDFANFDLSNYITNLPIELPEGYKNLSNTYSAVVTIDTYGLDGRDVKVSNIEFENIPDGLKAESLTDSIYVRVNGPRGEIENIDGSRIKAKVDLKGREESTGNIELPVSFEIEGADSSWVSGTYTISASIG